MYIQYIEYYIVKITVRTVTVNMHLCANVCACRPQHWCVNGLVAVS